MIIKYSHMLYDSVRKKGSCIQSFIQANDEGMATFYPLTVDAD